MARRIMPMIEISEVLYQWQQGRSKSKIAESQGISRPMLRNYLKLALAILRLGEKHCAQKFDEACRHLLQNGSNSHTAVKRLLEKGKPKTTKAPPPPPVSDEGLELLHPATSFGEVSL